MMHRMAAIWTWLIALLAFAAPLSPVLAQSTLPQVTVGDDKVAVEMFADGAPIAGEEWLLALRFTPNDSDEEQWHGYWSNPGDAGLGMQLQLSLPDGWKVGEAQYPVPQKFVQEIGDDTGLMNHIYKGEYSVLVPVSVPADADVNTVSSVAGYVGYLVCTDIICVPQDALLVSKQGGDFPKWRAEIAPLLASTAYFAKAGQTWKIAIPLPQSVALPDPHVFVANTELVDYVANQQFRRVGDMLIGHLVAEPFNPPPNVQMSPPAAPQKISGILSFGDGNGVRFVAVSGDIPNGGEFLATPGNQGAAMPAWWLLLLGALAGGLILNVMPCVFPILSIKALALAKAGGDERQARADALAYTAGVVLSCAALGAVMLALRAAGEQVGWAFQLQSPGIVVGLLLLAVAITANLGGLFELPQLSITGGSGKTGSFATGVLAAFVATPCTGPFMAAALGAALLLPIVPALLLFAALGLGLALPFLLIGFVPALRRILPRPGAWMDRFRKLMAIPMGLTALALVWLTIQIGGRGFAMMALIVCLGIVAAFMVVGRLQRAGKMAWPAWGLIAAPFLIFGAFALPASFAAQSSRIAEQSIHAPQSFSRENLAKARASGKPVFVWFTADWCVTCKVNEGVAIEREDVRAAFEKAGVVTIVGDWTQRDAVIGEFLAEQGAAGIPLYLWYEPGADRAEQLPQVLTQGMLSERSARPR